MGVWHEAWAGARAVRVVHCHHDEIIIHNLRHCT